MIISHKYRYVFVEIPLTASWSIHNEMHEFYDGHPILHKHATYPEFRQHASAEELKYFIFSTVRNPLDKIVSAYFKLKSNHKRIFTDNESPQQLIVDYSDIKKYKYIEKFGLDFESYFKKYRKIPYSDMIDLSSRYLDSVMRFENIQTEFSSLLANLGIEQVRPLPSSNKTPEKPRDFLSFYTPRIREQAKRICGPYMSKWDYRFPENWGDSSVSMLSNIEYKGINILRYIYAVYLRYNKAPYAVFLRKLRSMLYQ